VISITDILWWCCLDQCRSLREVRSVCDLGLQQIIPPPAPARFEFAVQQLAKLCGEPVNATLSECRTSAELWRRLNREIVSIDLVGEDPSLLRLDLNKDTVPERLQGYFDFVTNAGTSEHVFNQLNCFTAIHDLTKLNGIMAHVVPTSGFENHGLFVYPLKFFWHLARANHYVCLDAWTLDARMSRDPINLKSKPAVEAFLRDDAGLFSLVRASPDHPININRFSFDGYRSFDSCLYVFLKKTEAAPFSMPTDLDA